MRAATPNVVKVALVFVAVTIGAAACNASVSIGGEKKLSKAAVEKQTAKELAAQKNLPEPAITCPDDLVAKVGATLDCTLLAQGETQRYPVHLEVDKLADDGTAHYNIKVGDAPIADSDSTPQVTTP